MLIAHPSSRASLQACAYINYALGDQYIVITAPDKHVVGAFKCNNPKPQVIHASYHQTVERLNGILFLNNLMA